MTTPTILCGTDLGHEGARAVDLAAAFGAALGGKVVLLHATDASATADTTALPDSMAPTAATLEGRLRERLHREAAVLERERQRCESRGAPACDAMLAEGRPADALEREARALSASLIVLGRGDGKSGYVGPIAHQIMRRADRPVAFAPPTDQPPVALSGACWLVGVDFSRQSDVAVAAARGLAAACGGEIVLAEVMYAPGDEDHARERAVHDHHMREHAEKLRARAAEIGGRALFRPSDDRVAAELVAAADEIEATCVVIGSHGRTGLGRFFVGSTTDEVLNSARCPVLVVRETPSHVAPWMPPIETPLTDLSANHLVCAIDFSDPSRRALEVARHLAGRLGVAVDVVYVHEPATDVRRGLVGRIRRPTAPLSEVDREMMAAAKKQLDLLVRDVFGADAQTVGTHVESGRARERILRVARARNADLIVVGTTGRSGVARALLGSVAESLVRTSSMPVLTVH